MLWNSSNLSLRNQIIVCDIARWVTYNVFDVVSCVVSRSSCVVSFLFLIEDPRFLCPAVSFSSLSLEDQEILMNWSTNDKWYSLWKQHRDRIYKGEIITRALRIPREFPWKNLLESQDPYYNQQLFPRIKPPERNSRMTLPWPATLFHLILLATASNWSIHCTNWWKHRARLFTTCNY